MVIKDAKLRPRGVTNERKIRGEKRNPEEENAGNMQVLDTGRIQPFIKL